MSGGRDNASPTPMADTCDVARYAQGVWLLRSAVVLVLALWVDTVVATDAKPRNRKLPEAELVHMAPARVEVAGNAANHLANRTRRTGRATSVPALPPVVDSPPRRRGRVPADMLQAVRAVHVERPVGLQLGQTLTRVRRDPSESAASALVRRAAPTLAEQPVASVGAAGPDGVGMTAGKPVRISVPPAQLKGIRYSL